MNCPDCKEPEQEMEEDLLDMNKARDVFEVVYNCPACGTVVFGTLYRSEVTTPEEGGVEK